MTFEQNGAYSEVALIEVQAKGGTAYQFASLVEEFDPQEGDKDGESIKLTNGGRLWKQMPEEDYEITLKLYPLGIGQADTEDLVQGFLDTDGNWDATGALSQTNTRNRELFRVAFLWTDDPAATTAGGTTASGSIARRLSFKDARITGYKENWGGDKILSVDVTFKGPAFDKSGTGLIIRESVQSGDGVGLGALAAYS